MTGNKFFPVIKYEFYAKFGVEDKVVVRTSYPDKILPKSGFW